MKYLARLILFTILIFSGGCLSIPRQIKKKIADNTTRATDEAIKGSPKLQELNKICTDIPLPDDFVFEEKYLLTVGLNENLTYSYDSKTAFNESRKIFEDYFKEKDWRVRDMSDKYPPGLDFTDGNVNVSVGAESIGDGFAYTIYCKRLEN